MGFLFDEDPLIKGPVSHAAGYKASSRTQLVAVCDIDKDKAEQLAKKYGVEKVYTSYIDMLANESLDMVSVCTPPDAHAEVVIAAARKRVKGIFCEKPIAPSLKEADAMIEACKASESVLMINHSRRWDTNFQYVEDQIEKRTVGEIDLVNAFSTVGLLNGGTHVFDLLRMYLGNAISVSGCLLPDASTDPGARGTITFENGVTCFFDASWRRYVLFELQIYGQKGMMRAGGMVRAEKAVELFFGKESKNESGILELEKADTGDLQSAPLILNAIDNLARAIERKETVRCSGEDGRASLQIAMAFHASEDRGGQTVQLPLKDRGRYVKARETSFTKDGLLKR